MDSVNDGEDFIRIGSADGGMHYEVWLVIRKLA